MMKQTKYFSERGEFSKRNVYSVHGYFPNIHKYYAFSTINNPSLEKNS